MLRKKEKKAITSTIALLLGWPIALDKFLEGDNDRGFQIFVSWLITGLVFFNCLYQYTSYSLNEITNGLYEYEGDNGIGLLIFSSIAFSIGIIFFLRKLIENLRMFEDSEN